MGNDPIPLVDLGAQYAKYQTEIDTAISDCLAQSSFIGGVEHDHFATEFAEFCGGGFVALCGNGTDALTLAILDLLGPGDGSEEIITVSNTFIATIEAIVNAGYKPVLVDIDPDTYCMDIPSLNAAVTSASRAVIPVHLYGQMAPIDDICKIAKSHDLKVIEDAAQAHGASWRSHPPGYLSDAACFSFYPGKNLGAMGDGGAVFSTNSELINRISGRANHGRQEKYTHGTIGQNSRLDGIQAAILRVKLKYLPNWNESRRQCAEWYRDALAGLNGVSLPFASEDASHVYHLYVVEVENRDQVFDEMRNLGIGVGIHYPIPCHRQPALINHGYEAREFIKTEYACRRILSLPMFPELTRDQIDCVSDRLRSAIKS